MLPRWIYWVLVTMGSFLLFYDYPRNGGQGWEYVITGAFTCYVLAMAVRKRPDATPLHGTRTRHRR